VFPGRSSPTDNLGTIPELRFRVIRDGEPIGAVVIPANADPNRVRVDGFQARDAALGESVLTAIHEEWSAYEGASTITLVAGLLPRVGARLRVTFVDEVHTGHPGANDPYS